MHRANGSTVEKSMIGRGAMLMIPVRGFEPIALAITLSLVSGAGCHHLNINRFVPISCSIQ
jgi:hypothetical protein